MTIELGDRTLDLTQKQLLLGGAAVLGVLVAVCGLIFVGRLLLATGASALASDEPTPTPTRPAGVPTEAAAATATPRPQPPISSGVVSGTATPRPTATPELRVVVEAYMLNVRADAGADADIVGVVEQSDSLVVLGERGEWLNVETPDGTVGWVHGGYVKETR